MKPIWEIDEAAIQRWREFVNLNIRNDVAKDRHKRNVKRKDIDLSKSNLWKALVGCQVSTQQRSGPNTPVSRFISSTRPALDYKICQKDPSVQRMLERELTSAGLRRAPTIAANLTHILGELEGGEWNILMQHLSTLESNTTSGKEQKVAVYLQSRKYPGLGPKQSRNFIQWIGLSRYEIPLDSRVLKKLKELGCSFVPRAVALSDETVYRFVQNGLQQIAYKLDIYPCMLDACIFSSFDNNDA